MLNPYASAKRFSNIIIFLLQIFSYFVDMRNLHFSALSRLSKNLNALQKAGMWSGQIVRIEDIKDEILTTPKTLSEKIRLITVLSDKVDILSKYYTIPRAHRAIDDFWDGNNWRYSKQKIFAFFQDDKKVKQDTFYLLCLANDAESVKALLKDPDIDLSQAPDIYFAERMSPFLVACQEGYTNIVKLMIDTVAKRGRDELNQLLTRPDTIHHYTPLHLACINGELDLVQLLISHLPQTKEAFHPKTKQMGDTPFYLAVFYKNIDVVKYLLTLPLIDVNFQSERTVLHHVVSCCQFCFDEKDSALLDIMLADARIKLTAYDNKNRDPLACALVSNNLVGFKKIFAAKLMRSSRWNLLQLDEKMLVPEKVDQILNDMSHNILDIVAASRRKQSGNDAISVEEKLKWVKSGLDAAKNHLGLQAAYELLALVVLTTDNFLKVNANDSAMQFFQILGRLPYELQTLLCMQAFRIPKEVVSANEIEPILKMICHRYEIEKNHNLRKGTRQTETTWQASKMPIMVGTARASLSN
jgi:hypothetical protein